MLHILELAWVKWTNPSQGPKEGLSRTMVAISNTIMSKRLTKMRKKNYWLVEPSSTPHTAGNTKVLYHGTNASAYNAILKSQAFKPGSGGNLGPGVYMSTDLTICKMFGSYFLRADVNPGTVANVSGFVGNSWQGTSAQRATAS